MIKCKSSGAKSVKEIPPTKKWSMTMHDKKIDSIQAYLETPWTRELYIYQFLFWRFSSQKWHGSVNFWWYWFIFNCENGNMRGYEFVNFYEDWAKNAKMALKLCAVSCVTRYVSWIKALWEDDGFSFSTSRKSKPQSIAYTLVEITTLVGLSLSWPRMPLCGGQLGTIPFGKVHSFNIPGTVIYC